MKTNSTTSVILNKDDWGKFLFKLGLKTKNAGHPEGAMLDMGVFADGAPGFPCMITAVFHKDSPSISLFSSPLTKVASVNLQ